MRARPSSGSMFGEGSVLVNLGRKRRGLLEDAEKDGITWPRGVYMLSFLQFNLSVVSDSL